MEACWQVSDCFEGENNYFGLITLFFLVPSFLTGVWNKSRQKMRLQREWDRGRQLSAIEMHIRHFWVHLDVLKSQLV